MSRRTALVALLCGLLLCAACRGERSTGESGAQEGEGSPATWTLVSVGDINLAEDVEPLLEERGQAFQFAGTREHLAGDFLMGNLETVLVDKATRPRLDKSSLHKMKPELLSVLVAEGFDLLSIGNNHSMDQKARGMLAMTEHLDAAGMPYVGAGRNLADASKAVVVEGGGLKIAILGGYWHSGQKAKWDWYATDEAPGVFAIRERAWKTAIDELRREQDVDFVIANVHWGGNYVQEGSKQKRLARGLVAAGVDLVNGHGAHITQGVDLVGGVPVLYGLGNHAFGSKGIYRIKSPDMRLSTIARYVFGEGRLQRIELLPIRTDNTRTGYVPVPASAEQAALELEPVLARYSPRWVRRDDGWYVFDAPRRLAKP